MVLQFNNDLGSLDYTFLVLLWQWVSWRRYRNSQRYPLMGAQVGKNLLGFIYGLLWLFYLEQCSTVECIVVDSWFQLWDFFLVNLLYILRNCYCLLCNLRRVVIRLANFFSNLLFLVILFDFDIFTHHLQLLIYFFIYTSHVC